MAPPGAARRRPEAEAAAPAWWQRRKGPAARSSARAVAAIWTAAALATLGRWGCGVAGAAFLGAPNGAGEVVNTFFKQPLALIPEAEAALRPKKTPTDLASQLTQVGAPGVPRPLWLVVAASVPTGLLWYGAGYKLLAEEELYAYEVARGQTARGFGGPGTMGPFVLLLLLGLIAELLGLPGGAAWGLLGVAWIYFTQYLLYQRVNELYEQRGLPPPLHVWWLVFPGFNVIVGLRQVHFLARFWALERGEAPPEDRLAEFFPFIGDERYTWREFLRRPSLWFSFLKDAPDLEIGLLKD